MIQFGRLHFHTRFATGGVAVAAAPGGLEMPPRFLSISGSSAGSTPRQEVMLTCCQYFLLQKR